MLRILLLVVSLTHWPPSLSCTCTETIRLLADTVVLTHAQPSTSESSYAAIPDSVQHLLEKPADKEDNLRMLLDMNGAVVEVVTGVTIGQQHPPRWPL